MSHAASFNPLILPSWLTSRDLVGMQRGIEKESLRMQADGYLAQTAHPQALGAPLTHPHITTDYSEALLELITPPFKHPQQALDFLRGLHIEVQQNLPEGETLWPLSMPCMLDKQEENIPLAQYGASNAGQFKTLYRRGLGLRYGRRMQTIAGVHYNISFPDQLFAALQQDANTAPELQQLNLQDYRSARYFGLIRNFLRLSPLVIYLLGASPSVCACFLIGRQHHLQPLISGSLHLPEATALRMGRLGYQNSAQSQLGIHYNSLSGYLQGLKEAIATPYAEFSALGVDDAEGQPVQINDHILQIENEYYSFVRPKQIPLAGESPSDALARRGVAYVELRAVDVNPYSDIGIDINTACFLETVALYALLLDSPDITTQEQQLIESNQLKVVDQGRAADLMIQSVAGEQGFAAWASQHLQAMQVCAELLDGDQPERIYQHALQVMRGRVEQVEQTLSAQVLQDTVQAGGSWRFGHALAKNYAAVQKTTLLSEPLKSLLSQAAAQSWRDQQQQVQHDQVDFVSYVKQYRAQQSDAGDVKLKESV